MVKTFDSFSNFDFCVYIFLNPSKPGDYIYDDIKLNYAPIYVGKGKSSRPKNHTYKYRNGGTYFYNKLKNIVGLGYEPMWVIVKNNLSEIDAFKEEIRIISLIGRKSNGGLLYNLTDGGEGQSGFKHREESKLKTSLSLRSNNDWLLKMKSKEHSDSLSKSLKGHIGYGKGIPRSEEVKDKIRNSVIGNKNHFFGKTHSDKLKSEYSIKYSGKGNPNSKLYLVQFDEEVLKFEGRLELKSFLNDYNSKYNLKGPNRVSFDNLINRGKSKNFVLISIEPLNN